MNIKILIIKLVQVMPFPGLKLEFLQKNAYLDFFVFLKNGKYYHKL